MSETTKAKANGKTEAKSKATKPDDPEELRRDIADKRRELGNTAAELAAKADVKSQVKERVDERKEAVRDAGQRAQETVVAQASQRDPRAVAAAAAVLVMILLLMRRRRRR
jgi:anti-sigma-K factor RskA